MYIQQILNEYFDQVYGKQFRSEICPEDVLKNQFRNINFSKLNSRIYEIFD